jgi:predicted anti-sigma-YlaC factor YlaD
VKTCEDFEVLVSLRAAGALDPADAARLDAHLEGCASCRAEAAAAAEALALAALPPLSEAERRALRDLPARTLDALHRSERRGRLGRRVLAGVAVAAAAAALVLAPAALRDSPAVPATEVAAATWEEPDLDALWDDAELVDLEASAADGGDGADAAYAALDF